MTIEEFNQTGWTPGKRAKYHGDGQIYAIELCDFGEQLVGLRVLPKEPEEVSWVRCENITLIDH